jgi:hypothetical protein
MAKMCVRQAKYGPNFQNILSSSPPINLFSRMGIAGNWEGGRWHLRIFSKVAQNILIDLFPLNAKP